MSDINPGIYDSTAFFATDGKKNRVSAKSPGDGGVKQQTLLSTPESPGTPPPAFTVEEVLACSGDLHALKPVGTFWWEEDSGAICHEASFVWKDGAWTKHATPDIRTRLNDFFAQMRGVVQASANLTLLAKLDEPQPTGEQVKILKNTVEQLEGQIRIKDTAIQDLEGRVKDLRECQETIQKFSKERKGMIDEIRDLEAKVAEWKDRADENDSMYREAHQEWQKWASLCEEFEADRKDACDGLHVLDADLTLLVAAQEVLARRYTDSRLKLKQHENDDA